MTLNKLLVIGVVLVALSIIGILGYRQVTLSSPASRPAEAVISTGQTPISISQEVADAYNLARHKRMLTENLTELQQQQAEATADGTETTSPKNYNQEIARVDYDLANLPTSHKARLARLQHIKTAFTELVPPSQDVTQALTELAHGHTDAVRQHLEALAESPADIAPKQRAKIDELLARIALDHYDLKQAYKYYLAASENDDTASQYAMAAGMLAQDQGQYDQALQLIGQAVAILERKFGADSLQLVLPLNNLALIHNSLSDLEQSEILFRRIVDIAEQHYDLDDITLAPYLSSLANVYYAQQNLEQAEKVFERVLKLTDKNLPKEHPSSLNALNNMASLYRAQQKYELAAVLYRRTVNILEGIDDPNATAYLIRSLSYLAQVYQLQGKQEEAEQLLKRASKLSSGDSQYADINHQIDSLIDQCIIERNCPQLESRLLNVLAVAEQAHTPQFIIHVLAHLARLHYVQDQFEQAEPYLARAAALSQRTFGATHPETTMHQTNHQELLEVLKSDK